MNVCSIWPFAQISDDFYYLILAMFQVFWCSIIQGVSFNYHQRNVRSRSRTSRSRPRLLWQSLGLVSKFEPGLGPVPSPRRALSPQIETWNTINPWSFLSIFRMSSPPAQTQSPPIENFLATVVSRSRRLRSRLHHCKWNANFNKICRKSESNLLFRFENTVTEGTWSQSKP